MAGQNVKNLLQSNSQIRQKQKMSEILIFSVFVNLLHPARPITLYKRSWVIFRFIYGIRLLGSGLFMVSDY